MIEPLKEAERVKEIVLDGVKRKYYRFRGAPFYSSGVATADCVGCPLKCVFCWSNFPRDHPNIAGKFYPPEEVANILLKIAKQRGYSNLRVSGNEPTLGKEHLLYVLSALKDEPYLFILETSGILLDKRFAQDLSEFSNLHVRVSFKGTTPSEFSKLTGCKPEYYKLQFDAVKYLIDSGVSVHAAVMVSFSTEENVQKMCVKLREFYSDIQIEQEYVILYPHVIKRLKEAKLKPVVAYDPQGRIVFL
ncbi:MAG: radical SAM protein [Candidatus Odinarchaeia archaeon]